ncbi:MAG: Uma2 family endonuclease [Bryobacteraceae bacterium]
MSPLSAIPCPLPEFSKPPPLLCVEILSPSDRFSATLAKMERYRAFGVEACWIVDPVKKLAWAGADGRPSEEHDTLRAAEIEVPIPALFAA